MKKLEVAHPVTLVGGGELGAGDLALAMALAPTCVAADGGADAALAEGIEPDAVIGDLDSISAPVRAQIPSQKLHHIAEQDSTDFDKALRSISTPLVVAVGFTGGRIDHLLAGLHTLLCHAQQRIVILAAEDVIFLCPPRIALPTSDGDRVSLFPLGEVRGQSSGLFWPIDGLTFRPGMASGTSNRATGPVTLQMDGPKMLCLLPRRFIQPVVRELLALPAPALWPARAG